MEKKLVICSHSKTCIHGCIHKVLHVPNTDTALCTNNPCGIICEARCVTLGKYQKELKKYYKPCQQN